MVKKMKKCIDRFKKGSKEKNRLPKSERNVEKGTRGSLDCPLKAQKRPKKTQENSQSPRKEMQNRT